MDDKRPGNKFIIIVGGLSVLLGSIATAKCGVTGMIETEGVGYRTNVESREFSESNYEAR